MGSFSPRRAREKEKVSGVTSLFGGQWAVVPVAHPVEMTTGQLDSQTWRYPAWRGLGQKH